MKKKVALLLTLVMIFSLFAVGCGSNDDAEYAGTVKIGVFEPASGDNGAGGKQETLAEYYVRAHGHLLEDVSVIEISDDGTIKIVRDGSSIPAEAY